MKQIVTFEVDTKQLVRTMLDMKGVSGDLGATLVDIFLSADEKVDVFTELKLQIYGLKHLLTTEGKTKDAQDMG
jgi:hypothetical protein